MEGGVVYTFKFKPSGVNDWINSIQWVSSSFLYSASSLWSLCMPCLYCTTFNLSVYHSAYITILYKSILNYHCQDNGVSRLRTINNIWNQPATWREDVSSMGCPIENSYTIKFGPRALWFRCHPHTLTISGNASQAIQKTPEIIPSISLAQISSDLRVILPPQQRNTERTEDQDDTPSPHDTFFAAHITEEMDNNFK